MWMAAMCTLTARSANMKKIFTYLSFVLLFHSAPAQENELSKVWVPDLGNGMYRNPILYADYSDPDAIRVGDTYYMTASSFSHVPGLPILRSKDLVNWTLTGYALPRLQPASRYDSVQHGNGVWAPAIRFHNNEFRIYYPDPDLGVFMIRANKAEGPWSEPVLVESGKGIIDPCPFWDEDGKAYLVHAYAGSRAGIKSLIVIQPMDAAGMKTTGPDQLLYDGHKDDPTIEGPKMYKRNGYYYIFAPAGGVPTGWQLVLRSKNIMGPYERKVVMDQGTTKINGPHQGAWVDTRSGENWFLHFQDAEAYGRIVHLQPLQWKNDWPVIGYDPDGDGKGEPVLTHKKPNTGAAQPLATPPGTDEFNGDRPNLAWQWQANPQTGWAFMTGNALRLFAVPAAQPNWYVQPSLLLQKFTAPEFTATAKISFSPRWKGEQAGLIVFGTDYASIQLIQQEDGIHVATSRCTHAATNRSDQLTVSSDQPLRSEWVYLRVTVREKGSCTFSYSTDGTTFQTMGDPFTAMPGKWVGAKVGLFALSTVKTNDAGSADIDWFHIEK